MSLQEWREGSVPHNNDRPPSVTLKTIRQHWWIVVVAAVWSMGMLTVTIRSGVQHDYSAYLAIWTLIQSGADPWSTNNVYGPLFNTFSPLASWAPLGPKVFTAVLFIIVTIALAFLIYFSQLESRGLRIVLFALVIPFNYLVIGITFVYGLNDAVAASLIGIAVVARLREKLLITGILLGLAVLLKFYPAVIIPFFCLHDRRINLRVFYGSVTTVLTGMAASLIVWGGGIVAAWLWIGQRSPGFLSIQAALERSPLSAIPPQLTHFLGSLNLFLVVVAAGLSLGLCWLLKLHWLEGSSMGLLAVLLAYKGGHQQQYLPWLVLVAGLLLIRSRSAISLVVLSLPLVIFLSVFQMGFQFRSEDQFALIGILPTDAGYAVTALGLLTFLGFSGLHWFHTIKQKKSDYIPLEEAPLKER